MPLAVYRKKRDFDRTPEPRGAARKSRGKLRYVIQKHAASRLHYDFRLELDGVLKSWAVPKGPSLDPDEKRLAVEVEDHPLEYGGFEGIIPKGQYGGGTVLLWDRGTWAPSGDPEAGLRKGHLAFELNGKKLRGAFHLIRMRTAGDRSNWLLVKVNDAWAMPERRGSIVEERPESVASGKQIEQIAGARRPNVWESDRASSRPKATAKPKPKSRPQSPGGLPGARRGAMPRSAAPQLATLVKVAPMGDEWLHEIKFDGYRALCRIDGGRAKMITRSGQDWTERFAEIAAAMSDLGPTRAIVDGEVAVVLADGSTSFQALQNQLRHGDRGTLAYFAFDLLYLDGFDLTRVPLLLRKQALRQMLAGGGNGIVRYSDHVEGRGAPFHAEACRRGLEGIISKRAESEYVSGRSKSWLKIKCASRQEFVIGGYTDPQGARTGVGALLLGTRDNGDGLRYRGRVGTGFSHEMLEEIRRRLKPLETGDSPFAAPAPRPRGAHWVRPRLVAEVSFGSWTDAGLLRHPSFLGLREDKRARDVVRERPAGSREETPPSRRRPPDKPPRVPPPVHDPETPEAPKSPVEEPEPKPKKKPIREPLDQKVARSGSFARPGPSARPGPALTNPDRVLYPEQGLTKLDLAEYFHEIAPFLIEHAADRPLMLLRCPEGRGGSCFYQKHPGDKVSAGLDTVPIREKQGTKRYLLLRDEAGLMALAQMGVLEIHVWGARADRLEQPDRVVFDFDPHPSTPWKDVVTGAIRMRERLHGLGLESFVKTTGGKGLHVVVPIRRGLGWDEVKDFSGALGSALVREDPDRFTLHLAKARRGTRIFIDTLRNGRGATWVAPYSTRARPGAPVSMPISWEALTPRIRIRPDAFHVTRMLRERGRRRVDAWKGISSVRQTITASMVKAALRAAGK